MESEDWSFRQPKVQEWPSNYLALGNTQHCLLKMWSCSTFLENKTVNRANKKIARKIFIRFWIGVNSCARIVAPVVSPCYAIWRISKTRKSQPQLNLFLEWFLIYQRWSNENCGQVSTAKKITSWTAYLRYTIAITAVLNTRHVARWRVMFWTADKKVGICHLERNAQPLSFSWKIIISRAQNWRQLGER